MCSQQIPELQPGVSNFSAVHVVKFKVFHCIAFNFPFLMYDPEDAILDLEALVKVAKINNYEKAREYHECVLDQVQKHAKTFLLCLGRPFLP